MPPGPMSISGPGKRGSGILMSGPGKRGSGKLRSGPGNGGSGKLISGPGNGGSGRLMSGPGSGHGKVPLPGSPGKVGPNNPVVNTLPSSPSRFKRPLISVPSELR